MLICFLQNKRKKKKIFNIYFLDQKVAMQVGLSQFECYLNVCIYYFVGNLFLGHVYGGCIDPC